VLNHQTAFSKCSDDCEGDDSYNNIEYNIRCTGLVGSSCETSEDCDSDRNITCSDKWNNKTLAYSNEPKCIEWEECNKACGNETDMYNACWGTPPPGQEC